MNQDLMRRFLRNKPQDQDPTMTDKKTTGTREPTTYCLPTFEESYAFKAKHHNKLDTD